MHSLRLLILVLAVHGLTQAQTPVVFYDFEEGGGSVITNQATGATVQGTLFGAAAAWVAGAPGAHAGSRALAFDGLTAAGGGVRVETGFTPTVAGVKDGDYTVAAWVQNQRAVGDSILLGQFSATYLHLGFRDRLPYFGHHASDLGSLYPQPTNTWMHLAWVFEGGTASGVQRLYVNGVLDRAAGERVLMRTNDPLLVGATQNTGNIGSFQGLLDDLVIYSNALTRTQIAFLAGGGDPNALPAPVLSDRELYTAPFGPGGTWNLYEVVGFRHGRVDTWYNAFLNSTNLDPVASTGLRGHLVSIGSAAENEYVRRLQHQQTADYQYTHVDAAWLGLTDDTTGLIPFSNLETGKTNINVNVRRAAFTNWVDGTAVLFSTWSGGVVTNSEPNDSGVDPMGEDAIEMYNTGLWNDIQSNIPGSGQETPVRNNLCIIEWDLGLANPPTGGVGEVGFANPVLPPTLPGPVGGPDSFGGYWVRASAALGHLRDTAMRHLVLSQQPGYAGTVLTTNANLGVINAYDPEAAGNLHSILFPNNTPYFGNLPGAADVNFVAVYKGTLRIRAADAGRWTFGVHSDDGFALRIRGQRWVKTYGLGAIDPGDPQTFVYEPGSGDTNTRGVIDLAVGDYELEFVTFQGTGGNFHELYAAKGDFANDADTTTWRLVGHIQKPYGIPGLDDPGDGMGWTVWHSNPNAHGTIGDTNVAWNVVQPNYVQIDSNRTAWASINFYDLGPNDATAGSFPNSVRFPWDVNPANGAEPNVAMFLRGTLVIPTNGTYWLGFQGDDGSWLRVVGRNWDSIVYSAIAAPDSRIEGDRLVESIGTGNSRTIGAITLETGSYDVEMIWWQGVGGAHLEVLGAGAGAPGLIAASGTSVGLLGTGTARVEPDLPGLPLVSATEPVIAITPDTAYEGGQIHLTWNTERGAVYAIESSTDHGTWTPVASGLVAPSNGILTHAVADTFGEDFVVFRVVRVIP